VVSYFKKFCVHRIKGNPELSGGIANIRVGTSYIRKMVATLVYLRVKDELF